MLYMLFIIQPIVRNTLNKQIKKRLFRIQWSLCIPWVVFWVTIRFQNKSQTNNKDALTSMFKNRLGFKKEVIKTIRLMLLWYYYDIIDKIWHIILLYLSLILVKL